MKDYKIYTYEELLKIGKEFYTFDGYGSGFYGDSSDYWYLCYSESFEKSGREPTFTKSYFGDGDGAPYTGIAYETDLLSDEEYLAFVKTEAGKKQIENVKSIRYNEKIMKYGKKIMKYGKRIVKYTCYVDGEEFGDEVTFYPNGNLKSIISGTKRCFEGRCFKWHENGVLHIEGYYSEGLVMHRKYDINGKRATLIIV